ncbi:MAG: AI-2E family transporter [Acidobacteriota bacterium]
MGTERRDAGAHFVLVAAGLVVLIAGLRAAAGLITPLLVAVFLALVCLPLQNWLQSRRLPRAIAVLVTLTVAMLVLAVLIWVLGGSIRDLTRKAPVYKASLEEMTSGLFAALGARGIDISHQFEDLFNPARVLDIVTGTLGTLTAVLSSSFLVFLTITFILLEAAGFPDKLRAAFGAQQATARYDRIRHEMQHYLAIKSLVSLTTGSAVAVALAVVGVDFPILWGVLAFMLNYIPNLGSALAAIPPVLLAAVQLGPGRAVAVAVIFIVVNVVMGSIVEPHLMGRQLGLSTLVVFLSLVFWGWIWGPVGMLLSVPLTVIVKILLENTEDLRWVAVLLGSGQELPRATTAAHRKPAATG